MLVALTQFESELMQYLKKSVLLTPCIYGYVFGLASTEPNLTEELMSEVNVLRKDLGI